MSIPDLINGGFELWGGFSILGHCKAVLRDKAVAGVSIPSVVFFTAWGYWNLYYYPSLHQWWSFSGGILIVIANSIWVALLLKYYKRRAP